MHTGKRHHSLRSNRVRLLPRRHLRKCRHLHKCRRKARVTPPAHGTITVKRGTLKATNFTQCLATDVPAFVAFYYHAAQNFNGADEFELEVSFSGGRKQTQHFRVSVSNSPNGGQGI